VLFTPTGVLTGPGEMRTLFTTMFAEFTKPGTTFDLIRRDVRGETAFILWKAETADNMYEFCSDTFLVRDGKIGAQTFAADPSLRGGTVMQACLVLVGCALAVAAWPRSGDLPVLIAAVLLGAVVPFTLIVLLPTNKQLLDLSLDARSESAAKLLTRWGRLHAVRSVLSLAAFVLLLTHLM